MGKLEEDGERRETPVSKESFVSWLLYRGTLGAKNSAIEVPRPVII